MHANNGSTIVYSTDHNKVCRMVTKTIEAATQPVSYFRLDHSCMPIDDIEMGAFCVF